MFECLENGILEIFRCKDYCCNCYRQPPRDALCKRCSKNVHPCRSVISIKLQSSFIEITLLYGCSPVYLLHIFRTPFTKEHLWTAASELCMCADIKVRLRTRSCAKDTATLIRRALEEAILTLLCNSKGY